MREYKAKYPFTLNQPQRILGQGNQPQEVAPGTSQPQQPVHHQPILEPHHPQSSESQTYNDEQVDKPVVSNIPSGASRHPASIDIGYDSDLVINTQSKDRESSEKKKDRDDNTIILNGGVKGNLPLQKENPKEVIDKPQQLTKIYIPKLIIDTKEQDDQSLIDQTLTKESMGSITPTSIRFRTYEKSLNDGWFIDTYEFDDKTVISYRIDEKRTMPSENKFQGIEVKIDEKRPTVNLGNYKENDLQKVLYTEIEKTVLKKALNYLLAGNNSVVLVSILDRAGDMLYTTTTKPIEPHTLVLYKDPILTADNKQKITVIDPSNFIFSSHLRNLQDHEFFTELQKNHPFTIETQHSGLQIYKPNPKSKVDGYRDCVDIAVKLALGFIEEKKSINLQEIKKNEIVKLLSNQSGISDIVTDTDIPIRIKQTSSLKTVKAFCKIEYDIYIEKFKKISSLDENTQKELRSEHTKILASSSSNEEIIRKLLDFDKICIDSYRKFVSAQLTTFEKQHENLIGEINIDGEKYI